MSRTEMREPSFLVLVALAEQSLHGYAVMQRVKELSDGRLVLKPGSLYATIDRLEEEGLIEITGEDVVSGKLRRYYVLTDQGAQVVQSEVERLEANARRARTGLSTRLRGAIA